jgi:hypothetical protein
MNTLGKPLPTLARQSSHLSYIRIIAVLHLDLGLYLNLYPVALASHLFFANRTLALKETMNSTKHP